MTPQIRIKFTLKQSHHKKKYLPICPSMDVGQHTFEEVDWSDIRASQSYGKRGMAMGWMDGWKKLTIEFIVAQPSVKCHETFLVTIRFRLLHVPMLDRYSETVAMEK